MKLILETIAEAMNDLQLEYAFVHYDVNPKAYPYFVGECSETELNDESGQKQFTFLLTGFSRGSWFDLESARESIEFKFNRITGLRGASDDGSRCVITYASSQVVPQNDPELKRIQINLSCNEWKVVSND